MNIKERPRRLRRTAIVRNMVAQHQITLAGLIQPYFVCDGNGVREEIDGLQGVYLESVDALTRSIEADIELGIDKIMLFGVTDRKDTLASTAFDDANPVVHAAQALKDRFHDDLFIAADVCLCAYTDTGHCGVDVDGQVDNDRSVDQLSAMAVALARAGCDCVAPSDMMDGRVGAIRKALDREGLMDTVIMAYTAKYASAYYGPFREAAKSTPGSGDRQGYQMDFRNRAEALRELRLDQSEGADIVMVKPALAYLDIISDFRANTNLPVAAYNVSGEYAAVKLLAQEGLADERQIVLENLTAIQRAGASIILTYHLKDILKHDWLNR